MASDIDGTIATARRFTAVVQYFLHFILTSREIGFCNVECQMSNVGRNLTHVLLTGMLTILVKLLPLKVLLIPIPILLLKSIANTNTNTFVTIFFTVYYTSAMFFSTG